MNQQKYKQQTDQEWPPNGILGYRGESSTLLGHLFNQQIFIKYLLGSQEKNLLFMKHSKVSGGKQWAEMRF